MCRITSPAALICGVTSSATPEKNGVSVTLRLVLAAVPVTVLLLTSVTKNSSVPALITAFWLFSVATRGLDSTRVSPCTWSNSTNALKSPMSSAIANAAPIACVGNDVIGLPGPTVTSRPPIGPVNGGSWPICPPPDTSGNVPGVRPTAVTNWPSAARIAASSRPTPFVPPMSLSPAPARPSSTSSTQGPAAFKTSGARAV